MAEDVSTRQADSDSMDDGKRAEDEPEQNIADETIVDGRLPGLDPSYEDDSPSAIEAEIQANEKIGGA